MELELASMRREIGQLRRDIAAIGHPRIGELAPMEATISGKALLLGQGLRFPVKAEAEALSVGHGEGDAIVYRSGSTLVLQIFDLDGGTFRTVVLT
jgi:hypothetical protein